MRLTRCHPLPECPFDDLRCCELGSVFRDEGAATYVHNGGSDGVLWKPVGDMIWSVKISICKSNCIVKIEWEPGVNLQRFHKVCEALSMRDDASR